MVVPSPDSLLVQGPQAGRLRQEALQMATWDLTPTQVCDLELLLDGGFAPLKGYLGQEDHASVLRSMRLADGNLWPIPVSLDVTREFAAANGVRAGSRIALRHPEGILLAVLDVTEAWEPDRRAEAHAVAGTMDDAHPHVFHLLHERHPIYLGGHVAGIEPVPHHTYRHLRRTPGQLRAEFARRGWKRVVGFQTRNPMHRAHVELTRRAAEQHDAGLLLHPVVGRTGPGDLDYFTRVRCYEAVLPHYAPGSTVLSLLPLAMRMCGPREAVWHALIRRNHGCTHFIVGRDHAGPKDAAGKSYYAPEAARQLALEHAAEIGIGIVPFDEFVYDATDKRHRPRSEIPAAHQVLDVSGTELRRLLRAGQPIPEWFTYPEVADALRQMHPPRARQGFTVFFTGLPSSGKSTVANILVAKLMEQGGRPVTLLDGDIVRTHLSSELGFSREHRDLNIQRIAFVASEITKNGGIAVCAPIAPYDATRKKARRMVEAQGGFVLVHVATPLAECERRDRKGLYAKARAGLLKGFTGVDDPYEVPADADLAIGAEPGQEPEPAATAVLSHLRKAGFLG